MKKIFFVILGLLLLTAIASGAYFLFQKKDSGASLGSSFFGFGFGGSKDVGEGNKP